MDAPSVKPEPTTFTARRSPTPLASTAAQRRQCVSAVIACPACHGELGGDDSLLMCKACQTEYPVKCDVPVLLPPGGVSSVMPSTPRDNSLIAEFARKYWKVPSPTFEPRRLPRSIAGFLEQLGSDARVANVGSGGLRYGPNVINIDITLGDNVDVVGDALALPVRSEVLDGVISRRVLEHVRDPKAAAREMWRVLRPGGGVWCEIPFLQGYHPVPTDFQRYTRDGMAELFSQFDIRELGVGLGPSSTLSWVLREYLSILVAGRSRTGYRVAERVFSYALLPVKYFDVLVGRSPFAPQIASSFYLVAVK